jgi:hypothetical protein
MPLPLIIKVYYDFCIYLGDGVFPNRIELYIIIKKQKKKENL